MEYDHLESTRRLESFSSWAAVHYPDKELILFSKLVLIDTVATNQKIRQVPWEWQTRARLLHTALKFVYQKAPLFKEQKIHIIASHTYAMFDLGVHQISSLRPTGWTANALANIIFANRYGLPFIMAPQSFGPFHYYPIILRLLYGAMIREILPYATKIGVIEYNSLVALCRISDKVIYTKKLESFLKAIEQIGI